jgi:hypothetical protein
MSENTDNLKKNNRISKKKINVDKQKQIKEEKEQIKEDNKEQIKEQIKKKEEIKEDNKSYNSDSKEKKARYSNARKLPENLKVKVLPKYITYNYEKSLEREYFRIEKHPKQTKYILSSKSKKVDINDKYNEIIEKLKELENN